MNANSFPESLARLGAELHRLDSAFSYLDLWKRRKVGVGKEVLISEGGSIDRLEI